jgi:hypothetical protein
MGSKREGFIRRILSPAQWLSKPATSQLPAAWKERGQLRRFVKKLCAAETGAFFPPGGTPRL